MADDPPVDGDVPPAVRDWLADVAEGRELSQAELLAALEGVGGDGDRSAVRSRLDDLEAVVDDLDRELDRKLADVRDRVVQVKREADAKAPADHRHDAVEEEIERLAGKVGALGRDFVDATATLDELDERVERVDGRLEAGFENFESVLEYLLETDDDRRGKLGTLARALRDLRTRFDRVAATNARRTAAEGLRTDANEAGVTTAECTACGDTVHLGLLTAPECPQCAAQFTELEPRRGFFRTSRLHTGERPALEGATVADAPDLASIVADAESSPPPVEGVGASSDSEADAPAAGAPEAAPVDAVEGIGPTYAERLRGAGVETVTDLALADPGRLAEETDIAAGRIETLVARARRRADLE